MTAIATSGGHRPVQGKGLVAKFLLIIITVGTVPLVLAMALSYFQGNQSLRGVIGASFKALAFSTATQIDRQIEEEVRRISRLAEHPTLSLAVRERNLSDRNLDASEEKRLEAEWNSGGPLRKEILHNAGSRVLHGFLNQNHQTSQAVKSVFITDGRGTLVSSSNDFPGYNNTTRSSWIKLIRDKTVSLYIGDLQHDPKTDAYLFEFAVPIRDRSGVVQGAFHHLFDAKAFFFPSIEELLFGQTGHVMLINSDGVVYACPILPTGHRLGDPELLHAVTPEEPAWVETMGNGHGSREFSIIGVSPLQGVNAKMLGSTGKRLYTFAWQSSEELFAPTQDLFLWSASAGLISIFLITLMGSFAARRMVKPIQKLKKAAEAIGRGEQVEPLTIDTGDEIQTLAEEINTMNALLKKAFSGLEQKVEEKTREVDYLREYTDCILMSVPEVIIIFDDNLRVEYANAAFEKLTGLNTDASAEKTLAELPLENGDKWAQVIKELSAFVKGRKPASLIPSTSLKDYQAKDPLAPGEQQAEELPFNIQIGEKIFAYLFFNVALEARNVKRTGLIMKDITEEKKLLDQLTLADKLSGLGTLAAGIAHEMNNPLYSIMGFTEAIKDETDPQKIQKFADKVLSRSRQMASIILNLTGYSRSNGTDLPQPVDVNEQIDSAVEMAVLASLSDDVVLEKHYGTLPPLLAKPEEIQQVALNIIRNSVQAMGGKGEIKIETEHRAGQIVIRIQDNGPGIPKDFVAKIFDPFFTTKAQGEGTGLGLNLVHRIVQKYGGEIRVDSDIGMGARFTITFPSSEEVRQQEPAPTV